MAELTDAIRKEVDKGLVPRSAKVGDTFQLSTGDYIRITEILDNNRVNYTLLDGPIRTKKVEKKLEVQKLPSNTISTSNINLSASGTSGTIPITDYTMSMPVIVDDSKVDSDRVKITNKKIKDPDPYNWYIKKRLKY